MHILVVGLLIAHKGIGISFAVFLVGLITFVILSLFVRFDYQMMLATTNNGNRRTTTTYDNSDDLNEEERSSLLTGKSNTAGGNYLYNPASTSEPTWLQNTRRNSSSTTLQRRDSNTNSLYLTTTTTVMAMSVQMEAEQELHASSTLPSLGLVISYIPTLDTSLSALGTIHDGAAGDLPEPSILKTILVYTFLLSILLYGLAYSMISQFLFLLLKDLGMDASMMGWTGPIGGSAEVLTFWLSRKV